MRRWRFDTRATTAVVTLLFVICVSLSAQAQVFTEDFDGVTLEPPFTPDRVDDGDGTDWTDFEPDGWTRDNSNHTTGTLEFDGWTFVDPAFWVATAGQRRDEFTKGQNVIAVADADEWDDAGNPSTIGEFNSFLSTPDFSLGGAEPGTLNLQFDSSWRPFDEMTGTVTVSFDGGPEIELLRLDSTVPEAINDTVVLPLNNPAGASEAKITWGLTQGGNDWWWAFDNVLVLAGDASLSVNVDRDTGAIELTNGTVNDVQISNYAIRSAFESLDPDNWLSIADNYDADGDGSVDAANQWTEVSTTNAELSEEVSGGANGATLAAGQSITLADSGAWIQTHVEDLVFEFETDGSVEAGIVNYSGNDGNGYIFADLDVDNDIDLDDWVILRENQHVDLSGLSLAGAYRQGDLTGDKLNNHADFAMFKMLFDAANGQGAFAAAVAGGVPEPSSLILACFVIGLGLLARARRRTGTCN